MNENVERLMNAASLLLIREVAAGRDLSEDRILTDILNKLNAIDEGLIEACISIWVLAGNPSLTTEQRAMLGLEG